LIKTGAAFAAPFRRRTEGVVKFFGPSLGKFRILGSEAAGGLSPGFQPVCCDIMRALFEGRMVLSRRDSTKVARHEVPGIMRKIPRPSGTIEPMSSVSTTNICGTDNDFDRPSGTGVSLHRYPGTLCLATISLSLRDKSHSPIEAPQNYLSADGSEPREADPFVLF
jgi:hypothetical protein